METVPCVGCGEFFTPRNREQNFCKKTECQKARKAAWQRNKMHTDPDYKADQELSKKKWAQANPDYWKNYRENNPEKAERNRMLQAIRNRRRAKSRHSNIKMYPSLIAKMDARKSNEFNPVGQFWLVPVIAKMDVRKVNIYTITDRYH
jgi:hypothetical protein